MAKLDADDLQTWTTAGLVCHLADWTARKKPKAERDNAVLVAAELNMRIPPRKAKQ